MYIDPESVLNREAFMLIEQNVICPICSGILVSPIQCLNCENCFCELCLEEWKKAKGDKNCPFRCANPTFKNSRLIKNILSNIKFKCKNGCKEEIPYLELENHYEDKCSKLEIDYKQKYYEFKNKYLEILKKNVELEKELKKYKNQNNNNNNVCFNSKYHNHTLYDQTDDESDWICNICNNKYKAKTEKRYNCDDCDFDICLKCKILEESGYKNKNIFRSKNHQHLLFDNDISKIVSLLGWTCDVCDKHYKAKATLNRYRCSKCNFDICETCKMDEENDMNRLNSQFGNMQIES